MRFFFCAFSGFYLAIPIRSVLSLMLYSAETTQAVEYREQNGNTYFSLPHLLYMPDERIRHGIVLKEPGEDEGEAEAEQVIENKNILLTTEVEREIDIPETEIYPLPRVLAGTGVAGMFSGIQFASGGAGGGSLVLVLDPEYVVTRNKEGMPFELQPKEVHS